MDLFSDILIIMNSFVGMLKNMGAANLALQVLKESSKENLLILPELTYNWKISLIPIRTKCVGP